MPETIEELKNHFNRETSKISWQELQRYYARGIVVAVAPGIDLIEVAINMHNDNKPTVEEWLQSGQVYKVDDQHAQQWVESEAVHWAVVVAPWVLVQEVDTSS